MVYITWFQTNKSSQKSTISVCNDYLAFAACFKLEIVLPAPTRRAGPHWHMACI